jgi:glycosyltransferase involved in cell wall biosynthesis
MPWVPEEREAGYCRVTAYTGYSGSCTRVVKLANYLRATARLTRQLTRAPGLVHMQSVEVPHVDAFLLSRLRKAGGTIVFTPHDIRHRKGYPFGRAAMHALYRSAHQLIVHSGQDLEQMRDLDPDLASKTTVIPHGGYSRYLVPGLSREVARRELSLPASPRILLFFGDIRPGKGLDLLVRALASGGRWETMLLVVAGRPSHGLTDDSVRKLCTAVQGATELRLGFIPDRDVQRYFAASDLVLLPYEEVSESGVFHFARSCRRAVLCSDLPLFREYVERGRTGLLCDASQPESLRETLANALERDDLDAMGKQGHEDWSASHGWDAIARSTCDVYARALSVSGKGGA